MSRYGAYVRQRAEQFAETWGDTEPAGFASTAWRVATGPIMSPAYVRYHSRVLSAAVDRNGWDGSLTATVQLVTPWPRPLAASRDWRRDIRWRDWIVEPGWEGDVYVGPSERDVTQNPYLIASAALVFAVPTGRLPAPPPGPYDDMEDTARRAVAGLVAELNHIVGPAIDTLDNS